MLRSLRRELAQLLFVAAVVVDKKTILGMLGKLVHEELESAISNTLYRDSQVAAMRQRGAKLDTELEALLARIRQANAMLRTHRKPTAVDN